MTTPYRWGRLVQPCRGTPVRRSKATVTVYLSLTDRFQGVFLNPQVTAPAKGRPRGRDLTRRPWRDYYERCRAERALLTASALAEDIKSAHRVRCKIRRLRDMT